MKKDLSFRKFTPSLLIAVISILCFYSCKKDTKVPAPHLSLKRIKEYKKDDGFIRFSYNINGTVNKITLKDELITEQNTVEYTIAYLDQDKIAALSSNNQRIVPVYENGVMVRSENYKGPHQLGHTSYNYQNGNIVKATIYAGSGDESFPVMEYNFIYNSLGNIIQSEVFVNGRPNQLVRFGHFEYIFDNKVNPLYEQRELLWLFQMFVSKNNNLQEQHFDFDLAPKDVHDYTYIYNSQGLPENALISVTSPGESASTSNVQFIYE